MTDLEASTNPTRIRLLQLAQQFCREVESPSDDDMETLFWMLINRRLSALEAFVTNAAANQEEV